MHSNFGSSEWSPDERRSETEIEESCRQWQQTNYRQDYSGSQIARYRCQRHSPANQTKTYNNAQ